MKTNPWNYIQTSNIKWTEKFVFLYLAYKRNKDHESERKQGRYMGRAEEKM